MERMPHVFGRNVPLAQMDSLLNVASCPNEGKLGCRQGEEVKTNSREGVHCKVTFDKRPDNATRMEQLRPTRVES